MKSKIEFPATHSMSTSWYIVDDDGNVGILDYNANGPVPWGVEETCGDDLIFGHNEGDRFIGFNLSEIQILECLETPHKPSEEEDWWNCVVRIDTEKTPRFLELCSNDDVDSRDTFVLSEGLGYYLLDAYRCVNLSDNSINGSLKAMIDESIIIDVYTIKDIYVNDEWEDGEVNHIKCFDNVPYFIFHQPYSIDYLPQKMNTPEHPVRKNQIPEEFRPRLHRIPGKFTEMDAFQIIEYYPCKAYGDKSYIIGGCEYQLMPMADGGEAYFKTSLFNYDFSDFCSEKENCTNEYCYYICSIHQSEIILSDNPTVLVIFDPRERVDYYWVVRTDIIFQKAYVTPYLQYFPVANEKSKPLYDTDRTKLMTHESLCNVFYGSKGHLEQKISDMKPNVILITEKTMEIFQDVYEIRENQVFIHDEWYPIYSISKIEMYRAEIEQLATSPYRGEVHPLKITSEEMEELVKSGIAK